MVFRGNILGIAWFLGENCAIVVNHLGTNREINRSDPGSAGVETGPFFTNFKEALLISLYSPAWGISLLFNI